MSWTILPVAQFSDYAERWDRLNAAGPRSPLLRSVFVRPLIAEFGRPDLVLALHGDFAAPTAMGIFGRTGAVAWQTFQPSVAPLGVWLAQTGQPLESLLASLAPALPRPALLIGLTQQDPHFAPRPHSGSRVRTLDYIQTARIEIRGSFDEFWNSLGKNLRHTIKRLQNRLEREKTPMRFDLLTDSARMEQAVTEYSGLERAGWKGREGTAVQGDDDQARFYVAMLQEFCREGRGLVYQLHLDGRLVASDLCIHDGRTIIILKTAYDENAKAWSPAQLMRYLAFQKFFDEMKLGAIEFYGPVKDWHTKLTDDIRTMYHVNFYRAPVFADVHRLIQRRTPTPEMAGAD